MANPFYASSKEQFEELLLADPITESQSRLVVFNDEVNTFDWVIECFVEVCGHTVAQAEQLSYIIHFKGKATVKTGDKKELGPFKEALLERGLSAVIES